ncbi:MAG: MYXO-CTERM sorting domain-containing protein [Kofleriaceae bacterium]
MSEVPDRIVAALGAAFVALIARPAPAAACSCEGLSPDEALAHAAVAFDGWAVEHVALAGPPTCALPPAPAARPGCATVLLWDLRACAPLAGEVTLAAPDGSAAATDDDGTLEACGGAPGRYRIDTMIGAGRIRLDLELPGDGAGASRAIAVDTATEWKTRFQVQAGLRGEVGDEVWVSYHTVGAACGINQFELGAGYRVLGGFDQDGTVRVGACGGTSRRRLAGAPTVSRPPTAAGSPAATPDTDAGGAALSPSATPRARGCGGCASGGDAAPAIGVGLLGLAVVVRPRRRRR